MSLLLSLMLLAGAAAPEARVTATRSGARAMVIVDWPDYPVRLPSGVDHERTSCFGIPAGFTVSKIATFIGNDRGNWVEADIQVFTPEGYYLLQRSEHRETSGQYDAWRTDKLDDPWTGPRLCVSLVGRSTDSRAVRLHWSVRIEGLAP